MTNQLTVVPRSPSSILFALILLLTLSLVVWWTSFQVSASRELEAAGARLAAGDIDGASKALGAADAADLTALAHRRVTMFASEGIFFAVVLLGLGLLYIASVRREASLRASQDRFLAAATHELKTPLATLVLLLESLKGDRLPAEKRDRYLATGLLEAERLERGLDNVLIAAGLQTARNARPTRGDLAADVRAAIEAMRPRAQAANIALDAQIPAQLPTVRDGAALQLVLRNLLDNAVKYSPEGSSVTVAWRPDARSAEIAVSDTGVGIPPEDLPRVFDRFYRADPSRAGASAGLGLSICKWIAEAHGGTISAESTAGAGSVFAVRLPIR
jgi:two-component system phosphate regulon sensor histidine kinase PhoR